MGIDFADLTDRQKYLVEARLRANEDPELGRYSLGQIARMKANPGLMSEMPERFRIMDFVKVKFDMALGHQSQEGGWDIDTMPIADFGNVNAAGALTVRSGFNSFPLVNPAHVIGSIDPEPFELTTLAAVTGDRQIGTSAGTIVLLLGCYLVHITGAAAVYQPVTTVYNVRVISTNLAVGGAFTTLATLNVSAAANFVDQVPIVATTGRTVSITGTTLAGIAGLFNGDSLFGECVMGGAVNHQGAILYGMLELA
jgi:hypothetical protein